MRLLRGLIHFLASPVFLGLAILLYLNPGADHGAMMSGMRDHMAMMGMDTGSGTIRVFGLDLGVTASQVLGSMWLMYALMGLFHLGPWLGLLAPRKVASGTQGDAEPY